LKLVPGIFLGLKAGGHETLHNPTVIYEPNVSQPHEPQRPVTGIPLSFTAYYDHSLILLLSADVNKEGFHNDSVMNYVKR
jgi:hypothetical protein